MPSASSTPPTRPPSPRPPRLRLRFTLRLLLATLTLLCLALGLWTHRAREQRRIVEQIINQAGSVQYDYEVEIPSRENSPLPQWLVERFGIDSFHQVKNAGLAHDDPLPDLSRLPGLESLGIQSAEISEQSLRQVSQLVGLNGLMLHADELHSEHLAHLLPMQRLTELQMGPDSARPLRLGKSEFQTIARLPKLDWLMLEVFSLTKEDAALLADSTTLTRVFIDAQEVDDGVEEPFRSTGRVESLRIRRYLNIGDCTVIAEWDNR